MGIEPVTLYVHGDTGRRSGFLPAVLILKHYKMTFQEENTAGLNLLQVERGSNLFFFLNNAEWYKCYRCITTSEKQVKKKSSIFSLLNNN